MSKPEAGLLASFAMFGPTPLTQHGLIRSQQRSIPRDVIELLIDFGEEEAAGGGCYRYFFTRRAWHAMSRHCDMKVRRFERYRNAYVVVCGDGLVVTVGWLH
jgi:hypothetical protein